MLERLIRDEAGVTMALTVVMIVLIGVMGAGLLTFVRSDLEAVVEANQGQKAIEVADAGIQAARHQLLLNAFPHQYNNPDTAALPEDSSTPNSEWAFDSTSVACGALPSGPGKCITTPQGNAQVTIRYLPPPPTAAQRTESDYAPVAPPGGAADYPDKRDYFRVESDGVYNGARRKVQAILVTTDLGLPEAYFATRNIVLGSEATTISGVSLFSTGNVDGLRERMLKGTDSAYGNWASDPASGAANPYNNKARLGTATGVGAEGTITYSPISYNNSQTNAPAETTDRYERLDFDSISNLPGGYRFCREGNCGWTSGSSQPADVITYPFDVQARLDWDFLQSLAEQQVRPGTGPTTSRDNYYTAPGGHTASHTIDEENFYQVSPRLTSIYIVRFTGSQKGSVTLGSNQPPGSPCLGGTILVINGDFNTSNSGDRSFDGVISVQDPNSLGTLQYTNFGNFTLNGYASVEGTMNIKGSVNPLLGNDILNQPGYHDVELWS